MKRSIQKYFHYFDVSELERMRALYGDGELGERPVLASVYSAIRHRRLPERYPEAVGYGTNFCEAYHKAILKVLEEYGLADLPVLCNASFGHNQPMVTLPYGALAEIDCGKPSFCLLEPGVL